jgi:hypothetical protein
MSGTLRERLREVRVVFDLSASDNSIIPSVPISVSALSENENTLSQLQLRSSSVRDEFDMSASANLIVALSPIQLSVLSENETKQQVCTAEIK